MKRILPCIMLLFAAQWAAAFENVETKLIRAGQKAQTLKVELNGADGVYLTADCGGDSYNSDQPFGQNRRSLMPKASQHG